MECANLDVVMTQDAQPQAAAPRPRDPRLPRWRLGRRRGQFSLIVLGLQFLPINHLFCHICFRAWQYLDTEKYPNTAEYLNLAFIHKLKTQFRVCLCRCGCRNKRDISSYSIAGDWRKGIRTPVSPLSPAAAQGEGAPAFKGAALTPVKREPSSGQLLGKTGWLF